MGLRVICESFNLKNVQGKRNRLVVLKSFFFMWGKVFGFVVIDTYKTNDEQAINTIEFSINDQLFLETLLMIIRGNTIQFSSFHKRKIQKKKTNQKQIKRN